MRFLLYDSSEASEASLCGSVAQILRKKGDPLLKKRRCFQGKGREFNISSDKGKRLANDSQQREYEKKKNRRNKALQVKLFRNVSSTQFRAAARCCRQWGARSSSGLLKKADRREGASATRGKNGEALLQPVIVLSVFQALCLSRTLHTAQRH